MIATYTPTGIVHQITVDIGNIRCIPQSVKLTQGDDSLPVIAIALTNGNQPYSIPDDATDVRIVMMKPDGKLYGASTQGIDSTKQIAYFEVGQQACAAAGRGSAIVQVVVNDQIAGTGSFGISITPNPQSTAVPSQTELGYFDQAVKDAQNAAANAAAEAAQEAVTQVETQIDQKVTDAVTEQMQPYTQQVSTLQTNVSQLQTDVSGLQTDVSALQSDVSQIKETIPQIQSDVSQLQTNVSGLQEDVTALQNNKADAIVETVSGESLNVNDASNLSLRNLKIFGKATQEGTPSTETEAPITVAGSNGSIHINFTGANLIYVNDYEEFFEGITAKGSGGVINITGIPSGNNFNSKISTFTTPSSGKYFLSKNLSSDSTDIRIIYKINNGAFINGEDYQILTLNEGDSVDFYLRITIPIGQAINCIMSPMLNVGESALPFVPYTIQTFTVATPDGLPGLPVDSGGNYTDAKGQQWWSDCKDYGRGKYIQNCLNIIANSENISTVSKKDPYTTVTFILGKIHDDSTGYTRRSIPSICNKFDFTDQSSLPENPVGKFTCITTGDSGWGGYARASFYVPNTIATKEDFLSYVGNDMEILSIQQPVETDLSTEEISAYKALHTYKTVTNVSSGSDPQAGIVMDYAADTKTYIDNKFNAMASAMMAKIGG